MFSPVLEIDVVRSGIDLRTTLLRLTTPSFCKGVRQKCNLTQRRKGRNVSLNYFYFAFLAT